MKSMFVVILLFLATAGIQAQTDSWQEKKYTEALKEYNKKNFNAAIENISVILYADSAKYYHRRALCFMKLNLYHASIADFDSTIKRDSRNPGAHNDRGVCYYNLGQYKQAVSDFSKACQLKPADSSFKKNLELAKKNLREKGDALSKRMSDSEHFREVETALATRYRIVDIPELEWALNYEKETLKPTRLPTKIQVSLSEKRGRAVLTTLDSELKGKPGKEKLNIFFTYLERQTDTDFYAAFYMLLRTGHFVYSSDTLRLLTSMLPERKRKAINTLANYNIARSSARNDPSKEPDYPASVPLPGKPWNDNLPISTPSSYSSNTTVAKPKVETEEVKAKRLADFEIDQYNTGCIGQYHTISENGQRYHFHVTGYDRDKNSFTGILSYENNSNKSGHTYQLISIPATGKGVPKSVSYTYSRFTVSICQKCNGTGNGKSRNGYKTYETYESNEYSKYYGERVRKTEAVYDFYPCDACKGKGVFEKLR